MCKVTDGKSFVMENPFKAGEYLSTTSPLQAKDFTFTKAKALLDDKRKSMSWIKDFYIIDGNGDRISKNYRGNIPTGSLDIDFDLLDTIENKISNNKSDEFDLNQLFSYREKISYNLSQCDLAISDITHALEMYICNVGEKPTAHKLTVVGCKLLELLEGRRKVKKCKSYVDITIAGIKYNYSPARLQGRIKSVDNSEYQGKTEIYNEMINILYQ